MKKIRSRTEITAPVGTPESLSAAMEAGADSVYFGVGTLNMRARSSVNFTLRDLAKITRFCRNHGMKSYLTLNTVIYDRETGTMKRIVDAAVKNSVDAVIASDQAVIQYARQAGMAVHMSTQVNISNTAAVRYWSQFADTLVLARELSLDQVAAIARAVRREKINGPSGERVKLEIFAHGALCMAISGKCYLSLDHFNASANRGSCYQQCRRPYLVTDKDSGIELEIDNEYIMSPKDLCTIAFLDRVIAAGVSVLKIEGRGRSPEYVKAVVACYREAADAVAAGSFTPEKARDWMARLESVYNRGFWDGYYLGRTLGEWATQRGSAATRSKEYIGRVTNYYRKLNVAEITLDSGFLEKGDSLYIQGPTTGSVEIRVDTLHGNDGPVKRAVKGETCSIPSKTLLRRSDKVYRVNAAP